MNKKEQVKLSKMTWKMRVRNAYDSFEELKIYNEVYNIASRCGYTSCEEMWEENPIIGGSIHPEDFGLVKK